LTDTGAWKEVSDASIHRDQHREDLAAPVLTEREPFASNCPSRRSTR
jgi:hypothetical protein